MSNSICSKKPRANRSFQWALSAWQRLNESEQQYEQRWSRASEAEFRRARIALIVAFAIFEFVFLYGAFVLWISPMWPRVRFPAMGFLIVYAALLGLGAAQTLRRWLLFERQKLGRCLACGYDLRGIPLLCPECGKAIPKESVVTVRFTASDATAEQSDDLVVASLMSDLPAQRLTFQRSLPVDPDDWGIYLEYNSQQNSGFGVVLHCSLDRDRLKLELSQPIGHGPRYDGFEVALRIDAARWEAFVVAMWQIFVSKEDKLQIVGDRGD